mgnify:CR=1 FL=1
MSKVGQRFSLMTEFKRGSGDIDLSKIISGLLMSYGISDHTKFTTHPDILMISDADSHAQRFMINRFFNTVLSFIRVKQDIDTTEQRMLLITDGSNDDYLRHFETGIIPLLSQTGIPL